METEILGHKVETGDGDGKKGQRTPKVVVQLDDTNRIPPYWSEQLEIYIRKAFAQSDLAMFVHSKAVNKAASRDLTLENDEELYSEEDRDILADVFETVSGGINKVMKLFYADVFMSCKGGHLYVKGNSEMVDPPESMRYRKFTPEQVEGPLAPLEDTSGNVVTLPSGKPIYGIGLMHLDATHIQPTSDPEWPVIYKNAEGNRVPLHHTRVISYVDNPSPLRELNGIGKSPALRSLQTAISAKWDFQMTGQEIGDLPAWRILYPKKGMSLTELQDNVTSGFQAIKDGEGSIVMLGTEDPSSDELELAMLSLKQFPDDYSAQETFIRHSIKLAQAHYLTPADIGISLVLRSASRATSEAEAEAQAETGIPEIQTDVYKQINQKLLPQGLAYVAESLTSETVEEWDVRRRQLRLELNNYITNEVLGHLTALEILLENEVINQEQFDREAERVRRSPPVMPGTEPLSAKFQKKTKFEEEDEEDLAALIIAALLAQYTAVDYEALVQYVDDNDLDPESPEFIDEIMPAVIDNMPSLADGDTDFATILALLMVAGGEGVADGEGMGNRDMTDEERDEVIQSVSDNLGVRVDALFCLDPENANGETDGDIRNPMLENCLDEQSALFVAYMFRASLDEDEDEREAAYQDLAGGSASSRGEFVASNEYGRAVGLGVFLAVEVFQPLTKTWLLTTSDAPRQIHLDIVGETVGFYDNFSSGDFWSNELPNCQCGIEVGYE